LSPEPRDPQDTGLRHVILGLGGIGGLIAALLARSGAAVSAVLRSESAAAYDGNIHLASAAFGDFEVPVSTEATMHAPCDVLWVTVKAPQLAGAVEAIPPSVVRGALVIPLLNGIDHVALLRARYTESRVIAASIRVAAERTSPGRIVHRSGFAELVVAIDLMSGREEALVDALRNAGFGVRVAPDDATVLWGKLYLLAPLALATSIIEGPIGLARHDPSLGPMLSAALREAWTVARAEGADIEDGDLDARFESAMPDAMSSSLERDIRLGNANEFVAITEPILRGGEAHGIPTPAFAELARRTQSRIDA
jgi:2-dehydropantoate 2-reductase